MTLLGLRWFYGVVIQSTKSFLYLLSKIWIFQPQDGKSGIFVT